MKATQTTTQPPAAGQAAHTPTPWVASCGKILAACRQNIPLFAPVAGELSFDVVSANAAFIVTACNAYEANQAELARLREALANLVNLHDEAVFTCGEGDEADVDHTLFKARAALAQTSKE